MKCYKCGAEMPEGSRFCTECGANLGENTAAGPEAGSIVTAASGNPAAASPAADNTINSRPQPVYSEMRQAAPVYAAPKASKVVSTAAFFWLDVLYAIPVIGLIAAIIFAAASKNDNIRHHASAKLIAILVVIVLTILCGIITAAAMQQAGLTIEDLMRGYNYFY